MFKTDAIVIKRTPALNNDVFLTLLTEHMGKLDVVANRAKLIKSPLAPASKLFVYGNFILDTKYKIPKVTSCDIIRSHYRLLDDYDALMYATYFVEVINRTTQQGVSENDPFHLLLHLLDGLLQAGISKKFLRALFLVKLTAFMGWMPDLCACSVCGAELAEPIYFEAALGPICSACGKTDPVDAKWIRLLNYLRLLPYERIPKANVPDPYLNLAIRHMEAFIRYHAELPPFDTAEYLI